MQDDSNDSKRASFLLRTYRLRWERIQEFYLPEGHICTSLSVNPIMGEIMFACRSRGLLHYAWNKDSGVIYADQPCRVSYRDWGNVRLVKCEQDSGNYVVVNDQTLALVMVGYQQRQTAASAMPQVVPILRTSMLESEPGTLRSGQRRDAREAAVAGYECVAFESERCAVGDVRDVAIDTENERIYLLYRDKLCRRIYPDMRNYSGVAQSRANRCIGSELVSMAVGRRLVYVLSASGDIKVRLKLERMSNASDQLAWRVIGRRLVGCVPVASLYERVAAELKYLKSRNEGRLGTAVDSAAKPAFETHAFDAAVSGEASESVDILAARRYKVVSDVNSTDEPASGAAAAPANFEYSVGGGLIQDNYQMGGDQSELVELAGACVDSRRNILFAAAGPPGLYAMWQLNAAPDTGSAGWKANWLEDAWIDLSGPPPAKPLVPGAVACVAQSARRPAYLYLVDRQDCRRVLVIRYCTELARVVAPASADATISADTADNEPAGQAAPVVVVVGQGQ